MKHQALFPYKDKSKKKIKCLLLQFLCGALWVKDEEGVLFSVNMAR